MSMNFSQHVRIVSAFLAVTCGILPLAVAQGSGQKSSYYQTISIDSVLKSKPAVIYVSPKYQVTLIVNGREITGVSLELSKQKLFSVTLADNHRMIFLDALTSKGGADLNLILDDEMVLPIRLMTQDNPSGTRIYTFESSNTAEDGEAASAPPAAAPTPTPAPVAPAPAPAPASPPSGKATTPAPAQARVQAAPVKPSATQPAPAAPPAVQPVDLTRTLPAARMDVTATRAGPEATLGIKLTAINPEAVRAELKDLRLYDGWKPVPFTVIKAPKGRLLPVEVSLNVPNVPANLTVVWPVSNASSTGLATLKAQIALTQPAKGE